MLTVEKIVLNEERDVKLTVMIQAKKLPAVLILPGGGYNSCADHEAEPVAYPYLDAGFQAFILRYSVGRHKTWPNPLDDYEQAMTLIRENAEKWNVISEKIAVIGFSAGGHLAACAAAASKNRPNAAILGYAATGAELTSLMFPDTQAIVPTEHVNGDTCPCFLFTARDDVMVPVDNTLDFQQALNRHGIAFESHVYAFGGHGFSTVSNAFWDADICSRAPRWVKDSIEWLADMFGKVTPNGVAEPVCSPKINGNYEAVLSADCTIAHLKKQGEAVDQLLAPIMMIIDRAFPSENNEIMKLMVNASTLRKAMETLKIGKEEITRADAALKQMINKK